MSALPVATVTTDQMREIDRLMVDEYHISLEEMMENAGRNLADLAMEIIYEKKPPEDGYRIAVACGTGNNGGGGMVAARVLSNRGVTVTALLAGRESKLKEVPHRRWKTLRRLPMTTLTAKSDEQSGVFAGCHLIIDAIFGYGLRGSPKGLPARVIEEIMTVEEGNILSLDVPSGLNSTDGSFSETCVRATATMTLALPKTGLLVRNARTRVGDLFLADIGVPPSLYEEMGIPVSPPFTEETILHLSSV